MHSDTLPDIAENLGANDIPHWRGKRYVLIGRRSRQTRPRLNHPDEQKSLTRTANGAPISNYIHPEEEACEAAQ